ncbi:MAG: c-type cytochrome, partial [Bacteroidota bacterium]
LNPYLPDSSKAIIKKELTASRYGKMFIPPGKQTSIIFPGLDGGAEWGGPSYDPETGILYVNSNEMGWKLTLGETKNETPEKENYITAGQRLYTQNCMTCHGPDRKGSGNYPSIVDADKKYPKDSFLYLIASGRRMMPSFKHLADAEREAIASYVLNIKSEQKKAFVAPIKPIDTFRHLPYTITGYYKFVTPEGYPAIKPPWGSLTAINLNTGEQVWKNTLGEYPELKAKGVPPTGTENYGGPVVTAGGVVIIAASSDQKIRAFNKRNGKLLWEADLPAAGFATPAIYSVNNKQYIVIACGGGKLHKKSGDSYVAFALPDTAK